MLDGPTIDFVEGPSHPLFTAIIKVAVSNITKSDVGSVGAHVYVRLYRAPDISAEALEQVRPTEDVLLFLQIAPRNEEIYRYSGEPAEANGQPILSLVTPQGLLVEMQGKVVSPLADDGAFDPDIGSLGLVEQELDVLLERN